MTALWTLIILSLVKGIATLLGFVTNSAFPQPLSKAEEALCLQQMRNGDENARAILIERNLRLVAHLVKKYEGTGEDKEDLISIGIIGLIKAINTFNEEKQTKLSTYAARCVENEILMNFRATKNQKTEVYLQDPIGIDKEGNQITLLEILATDNEDIAEEIDRFYEQQKLWEKVKLLNKNERCILELRYGLSNGKRRTQREIAKQIGISRSYVSRIEKKAIQKLFRNLSPNT